MGFEIDSRVLERLEWPQVQERLHGHCRLSRTRRWAETLCASQPAGDDANAATGSLFESDPERVRGRLAETREARQLLDADFLPPFGHPPDVGPALERARRGGSLSGSELRGIHSNLACLLEMGRYLDRHSETIPNLREAVGEFAVDAHLAREIETCIDPSGEVSDRASPEIARSRREAAKLATSIQKKLGSTLRDPKVAPHLTDHYVTLRNDRYVLPVRADAKGRVRGIVHDASNSGTTLYVEPQAVVELNNELKQAELATAREVLRVLRKLSLRVREATPSLEVSLQKLEHLDWAFARAELSREMDAVEPVESKDGSFELLQLRHPLIDPGQCVPNDVRLGSDYRILVLSGPNAGGKTVTMKAVALAALFVRAGLFVPAAPGARIPFVDTVLADIGDEQDIRENLSTFSAHMANLAKIARTATDASLVVLDEIGVGTDPGEGAALAQAILESLADRGARVITTTHYNLLKEMAEVDDRFCNASVAFDPDTGAPTYRLRYDIAGASSARAVASRMGMPQSIVDRSHALLERDDRQLDRMLLELGANRAMLEREQGEAEAARAESEATRDAYRERLERLKAQREKLFQAMQSDLDRAFGEAHEQVAGVIRELQRGGRRTTAQEAAKAREELLSIEVPFAPESEVEREAPAELLRDPVDWKRMTPGDPVTIPGGGEASLLSLPDSRGRVRVQAGSARIELSAESIRSVARSTSKPDPTTLRTDTPAVAETEESLSGGNVEIALRGLRVAEALHAAEDALDRAARDCSDTVTFIHGIGTGALREAIHGFLRSSPYVADFRSAERNQGGAGVTIAVLRGAEE